MEVDSHRRVLFDPNLLSRDQVTGRVLRPSSAAFRPSAGEDGLSVYRHHLLAQLGIGLERIVALEIGGGVVGGLAAADIAVHGLQIRDDPVGQPPDIGPAHAILIGWSSWSRKQVRRVAKALADCAVCTHPGGAWEDISWP